MTGGIDPRGMRTLLVAVVLAGCASDPARDRAAAPLFRTAAVEVPPARPEPILPPVAGARKGVSLEIRFETSDGTTVLAPRITAFAGRRANVQVLRQTAYVRDFDVAKKDGTAVADPVIGILQDGIALEVRAHPAERGTLLSWVVQAARVREPMAKETFTDLQGNRCTIQLPTVDRSEAGGVRALADGVWGLLARLPDGKGGTVAVTARATAVDLEFDTAAEDARDIALVDEEASPGNRDSVLPEVAARPGAPAGSLEVRAVALRTQLPAGSVVEMSALGGAALEPLAPGDLAAVTQCVPGARVACLLDESFVGDFRYEKDPAPETVDPVVEVRVSGLEAAVGEDGLLDVRWTTTPRWDRFRFAPAGTHDLRRVSIERPASSTHAARLVPAPGTRLVVLAALADGRSAGVLVRFLPEETLAR